MIEVSGDSSRDGDWALVRLRLDGDRIVDADAEGLSEPLVGLTLIEALFSGTPVVGTRRGALPEIVTPEVGALGDTLDELIEGSRGIETRSAAACRTHAERYFSHITMAEQYVRLYRNLLATGALGPGQSIPYTTS